MSSGKNTKHNTATSDDPIVAEAHDNRLAPDEQKGLIEGLDLSNAKHVDIFFRALNLSLHSDNLGYAEILIAHGRDTIAERKPDLLRHAISPEGITFLRSLNVDLNVRQGSSSRFYLDSMAFELNEIPLFLALISDCKLKDGGPAPSYLDKYLVESEGPLESLQELRESLLHHIHLEDSEPKHWDHENIDSLFSSLKILDARILTFDPNDEGCDVIIKTVEAALTQLRQPKPKTPKAETEPSLDTELSPPVPDPELAERIASTAEPDLEVDPEPELLPEPSVEVASGTGVIPESIVEEITTPLSEAGPLFPSTEETEGALSLEHEEHTPIEPTRPELASPTLSIPDVTPYVSKIIPIVPEGLIEYSFDHACHTFTLKSEVVVIAVKFSVSSLQLREVKTFEPSEYTSDQCDNFLTRIDYSKFPKGEWMIAALKRKQDGSYKPSCQAYETTAEVYADSAEILDIVRKFGQTANVGAEKSVVERIMDLGVVSGRELVAGIIQKPPDPS